MPRHTALLSATALVAALTPAPPALAAPDVVRTLELTGDAVVIENPNGRVKVTTWNKAQVQLKATSDDDVEAIVFEAGAAGVVARVLSKDRSRPGRAELVVVIPERARLHVEGINTDVEVSVGAKLEVETVNGAITAQTSGKDARLQTVNGAIELEGPVLAAEVRTVSGALTLHTQRLEALQAETVSGAVRVEAAEVARGQHDVRSTSGTVRVRVPASVRVEAKRLDGTRVVGSADPGAPTVRVRTVSGSIDVGA